MHGDSFFLAVHDGGWEGWYRPIYGKTFIYGDIVDFYYCMFEYKNLRVHSKGGWKEDNVSWMVPQQSCRHGWTRFIEPSGTSPVRCVFCRLFPCGFIQCATWVILNSWLVTRRNLRNIFQWHYLQIMESFQRIVLNSIIEERAHSLLRVQALQKIYRGKAVQSR